MAGQVRQLIDTLMEIRSAGAPSAQSFVRAHLMMKGIHPDRYDAQSPDEPDKVAILEQMIHDYRSRQENT